MKKIYKKATVWSIAFTVLSFTWVFLDNDEKKLKWSKSDQGGSTDVERIKEGHDFEWKQSSSREKFDQVLSFFRRIPDQPQEVRFDRFQAAGLSFPVVFEGEVEEELKKIIMKDIYSVFQDYTEFSLLEDIPVEGYELDDGKYFLDRILHLSHPKGNHVPEALAAHFGRLIVKEDDYQMVIPSELIESYRNILNLLMQHPGMLEGLANFVHDLNNLDSWSLDYDFLIQKFYLYGEARQIRNNLRNYPENFIRYVSRLTYLYPSLLAIEDVPEVFDIEEEAYSVELWGSNDGERLQPSDLLIYINREWKIFSADY